MNACLSCRCAEVRLLLFDCNDVMLFCNLRGCAPLWLCQCNTSAYNYPAPRHPWTLVHCGGNNRCMSPDTCRRRTPYTQPRTRTSGPKYCNPHCQLWHAWSSTSLLSTHNTHQPLRYWHHVRQDTDWTDRRARIRECGVSRSAAQARWVSVPGLVGGHLSLRYGAARQESTQLYSS